MKKRKKIKNQKGKIDEKVRFGGGKKSAREMSEKEKAM